LTLQLCADINECETGDHNCQYGQYCHNRQGSYRCPGVCLCSIWIFFAINRKQEHTMTAKDN